MAEKTAQQLVMEEPIAENPLEPQQTSGQTIVPQQLVEGRAKPSTRVPSTELTEGDTSVGIVTE